MDLLDSYPPPRQIGVTFLCVADFGTPTDGITDATTAIQRAMDALPTSGGTVMIPAGLYLIDPVRSLHPKSRTRVLIDKDAHLISQTTDKPRTRMFMVDGVEDVEIIINGELMGDRDTHKYVDTGTSERTHEWNHGVWITGGSKRITVMGPGKVRDFAGDGVSASGEDIWVYGLKGIRNRRQGCTVGRGKTIRVVNNEFTDTQGTAPASGIDIEPDAPGGTEDVLIKGNKLLRNKGAGLTISTRVEPNGAPSATVNGVKVADNEVAFNTNGIELVRVNDIDLMGNFVHENTATGVKIGQAVSVHLAENRFAYNYRKLAVRVRTASEAFGWSKPMDRDILIGSTAGDNVRVGRNYLDAQS